MVHTACITGSSGTLSHPTKPTASRNVPGTAPNSRHNAANDVSDGVIGCFSATCHAIAPTTATATTLVAHHRSRPAVDHQRRRSGSSNPTTTIDSSTAAAPRSRAQHAITAVATAVHSHRDEPPRASTTSDTANAATAKVSVELGDSVPDRNASNGVNDSAANAAPAVVNAKPRCLRAASARTTTYNSSAFCSSSPVRASTSVRHIVEPNRAKIAGTT